MLSPRSAWFQCSATEESGAAGIRSAITEAGIDLSNDAPTGRPGIVCFSTITSDLIALIRGIRRSNALILALATSPAAISGGGAWRLLHAGATDTIVWNVDGSAARQVRARLERWTEIDELAGDATKWVPLIGSCAAWRDLVRRVVEAARFADTPVLLIGESGTGKELLARTIHMVDARAGGTPAHELVTVDCSTIVAELSGSEFFGHEKGAFTGAVNARD